MKEVRFFYVPNADSVNELPEEEVQHAVRVLRMEMDDEIMLMDGKGTFYRAVVLETTKKRCLYRIEEILPQERQWQPHLHLAMAPTKNMDRTEWFAEKATEIGFDELTFLKCRWSERTVIKTERIEKILISAMKQSHKAWKPVLNEMNTFTQFIEQPRAGVKYIAHCYEEIPRANLFDELRKHAEESEITVMIGPEGDFSIDEVRQAIDKGYQSVSLGASRLRTETAGLSAVMMMQLSKQ